MNTAQNHLSGWRLRRYSRPHHVLRYGPDPEYSFLLMHVEKQTEATKYLEFPQVPLSLVLYED